MIWSFRSRQTGRVAPDPIWFRLEIWNWLDDAARIGCDSLEWPHRSGSTGRFLIVTMIIGVVCREAFRSRARSALRLPRSRRIPSEQVMPLGMPMSKPAGVPDAACACVLGFPACGRCASPAPFLAEPPRPDVAN